ncbi:MAG: DUF445 family protein, partial [Planctomycetes bacterium]|nr:DUF445 family protein [Planctomycetota bacterium]
VALTAVSGTIGFLTNWIAIKMLFHPRRPLLRVGRRGFVQGLFPKNKALVARQVAAVVAGRLVNAAAIKAVLAERDVAGQARRWAQERLAALSRDERFRRDLSDWLYVKVVDLTPVVARKAHEVIDEYIDSRGALARGALRLGKTLLDIDEEAIAQRLRTHLDDRANFEGLFADLSRALDRLPDHLAADPRVADFERWMLDLIDALLHRLPVAEVVREQVMKQDEAEFERMVDAAGGRELAWIQILGGILGAIAGAGLFFVMS